MNISAAGNTEVPGILSIERLGFKLSCTSNGSEWRAEKDDSCFSASSPLELLGLIEMYRSRGVDWKASDLEIEKCIEEYVGLGGCNENITSTSKIYEQNRGRISVWLEVKQIQLILKQWRVLDEPSRNEMEEWSNIAFRLNAALHKSGRKGDENA